VVWVPAVLADAVQRPGCEPAAVMNLMAQRADYRSGRKFLPQAVTHDIGDIPRWSPGQGRLRRPGAVRRAWQARHDDRRALIAARQWIKREHTGGPARHQIMGRPGQKLTYASERAHELIVISPSDGMTNICVAFRPLRAP
jgi:hypothetical protein